MLPQKAAAKIPVKKADGSTVFLTMEEFRAYKAQASAPQPLPMTDPIPTVTIDPANTPKKMDEGKVEVLSVAPAPSPTPVIIEPVLPPKAIEKEPLDLPVVSESVQVSAPVSFPAPAPVSLPIPEDLPMIIGEQSLSTSTPVKNIFVEEAHSKDILLKDTLPSLQNEKNTQNILDTKNNTLSDFEEEFFEQKAPIEVPEPPLEEAAPQKAWTARDHTSLLDEKLEEDTLSSHPVIPVQDTAETVLAMVKKQLPLQIPKDIQGRFDSLLLSRIRGIRTEIDFEQYAKSPKEQGGLAFDEDQIRLVLAVLAAAQKIAGGSAPVSAAPSSPPISPVASSSPLPSVSPSIRRPTAINVTASHISQNAKVSGKIPLPAAEYTFAPSKDANISAKKPMIQDVVAVQMDRRTMGPVEEIQYFSLVDFRRLAPKTESAREILKSKFITIQEESYVLFLDARDAWLQSPLYKMYQNAVISALEMRKPLSEVVTGQSQSLTLDELNAIVEINHFLL